MMTSAVERAPTTFVVLETGEVVLVGAEAEGAGAEPEAEGAGAEPEAEGAGAEAEGAAAEADGAGAEPDATCTPEWALLCIAIW